MPRAPRPSGARRGSPSPAACRDAPASARRTAMRAASRTASSSRRSRGGRAASTASATFCCSSSRRIGVGSARPWTVTCGGAAGRPSASSTMVAKRGAVEGHALAVLCSVSPRGVEQRLAVGGKPPGRHLADHRGRPGREPHDLAVAGDDRLRARRTPRRAAPAPADAAPRHAPARRCAGAPRDTCASARPAPGGPRHGRNGRAR